MSTPSLSERDDRFIPRPEVARTSSLGFDAVLADYYWMQAIQLIGGENYRPERHGRAIGKLVDVVTTLDPHVGHPYRFAAVWMTESPEVVREANRLLERGIQYHPEDWRNRFYLGFNQFFYLEDAKAAADAFEGAIGLEGAPVYLSRLVARLRAEQQGLEVAAGLLREMIKSTEDPYAKAEYEKALDEIETERRARLLDKAREEYVRRNGRDIAKVEDLVAGPNPVLRALPPEIHGWEWTLDAESGQIVSSYLRKRYTPHLHPTERARLDAWKKQREDGEGAQ